MSDHDENAAIERIARELMEQYGANASWRARARADDEGNRGNFPAAVRWRLIADTIERLQDSSEASWPSKADRAARARGTPQQAPA
jgi:hypothetical protein